MNNIDYTFSEAAKNAANTIGNNIGNMFTDAMNNRSTYEKQNDLIYAKNHTEENKSLTMNIAKMGASYTIGSVYEQELYKKAEEARQKSRAAVDGVISMVESTLQDIATKGVNQLYDALGLNQETIGIAKTFVSTTKAATGAAGNIVKMGLLAMNSIDAQNIPMSVYAAGLSAVASLADYFFKEFFEKYGEIIDLALTMISDPAQALLVLKQMIDELAKTIYDMLDEQVYHYLGMSIAQIRYYCRKGIALYKQYKESKKKQREEKDGNSPSSQTGSSVHVNVKVSLASPEEIKARLYEWMLNQRSALFNGMIVMQIMDAIDQVKGAISMFTDLSITNLADTINSFDDFMRLMDELGLGDSSTAVDLSLIPNLGLNDIYASLNSIKDMNLQETATSLATLGGSFVNVNASISKEQTYTIETDGKNKSMSITLYGDPSNTSKKIYKVLTKAEDGDKKKLFSLANTKVIQSEIETLWKSCGGKSSKKEILVNDYTIKIAFDIQKEEDKKHQPNLPTTKPNVKEIAANIPSLAIISEDRKTEKENQKKKISAQKTIAVLHTVYSILKSVAPVLTNLAHLVQNYKINKEYARQQSGNCLNAYYKGVCAARGLVNSMSKNSMYTIRTYSFYNYLLIEGIIGMKDTKSTIKIDGKGREKANSWLSANDSTAPKIENKVNTLYIDYDSINAEKREIENQKKSLSRLMDEGLTDTFVRTSTKKKNGDFSNLSKVEVIGDEIMYSDSLLPLMNSQILTAQMNGTDPYKK